MTKILKYLFFSIVLLIPILGSSQPSMDTSSYAIDSWDKNRIAFAFGKAGSQSIPVKTVRNLMQQEKYDSLKALIHSQNPSLKYLSIRVCELEEKRKKIVLSAEEKKAIDAAKRSEEQLEYRSGCTVREIVTLKELFNNDKHRLNKSLKWWMKEIRK